MKPNRRVIVTEYVIHRVGVETKGRRGNQAALARALRCSGAHISKIAARRSGIGDDFAHAIAAHWGMDYAALTDAALAWWEREGKRGTAPSSPERAVELDDRYPTRSEARAVARSGGLPDAAIAEVDSIALDADGDPGVFFWIDQYRAAAARLAPRAPVRTDPAADTAASIARTKPRLPRR